MMRTKNLKEWVGRTPEAMPGQTVLLRLYAKQNEICACGCGQVMNLNRDKVDCDHIMALIDGGDNRESNLQLLLHACHKLKTSAEASARSEERRHKAKAFTALRNQPGTLPGARIKYSRARGVWVDRTTGQIVEAPTP